MRTIALLLAVSAAVSGPAEADQTGIEAISRPSGDVTLAFTVAGQVAKVLVKEGDPVGENAPLILLDDKAERLQLAQLKDQAEDQTRIKAAKAQLAQKGIVLTKKEQAYKTNAATELEVQEARLEVTIAELSLALAKFQNAQDRQKHREAEVRLSRMKLTSPIKGVVEQLGIKPGESADAQQKVIRVINIDPLWVEVPVPYAMALKLKAGMPAKVKSSGPGGKTADGTINRVRGEADPASDTVLVRVEVPNPSGRTAGEHVTVSFPEKTGKKDAAHKKPSAGEPKE